MLVPSIDIQNNSTVQLIGGKEKALDAGNPIPLARKFSTVGEIAIIDLDAAMNRGSNTSLVKDIVEQYPCRVGGGIRNLETAIKWLDSGARKIIVGTAANKEFLSQLPKDRVLAALDNDSGDIVVDGWQTKTQNTVENKIAELKDYVGGFLITFVEREGRMQGIDIDRAKRYKELVGSSSLTVAGGITTASEIRELDKYDIDAQVGMAIYSGKLPLIDAFLAPMNPDNKDALWPTVVTNEQNKALGLAWSNRESIEQAIKSQAGIYHSRKRGLWIKGESSGNRQELLHVDYDCDRDALRFTVRQKGNGFCHTGSWTCWGDDSGLNRLERRLNSRLGEAPAGSYTKRLFDDPEFLNAKLIEETNEFIVADNPTDISAEAADLIYFLMVKLVKSKTSLNDVIEILNKRELKVTRRPGNAKLIGKTNEK